ncbi:hypothetical protein AVEN_133911-1 [Araneus ventricosus]|uniref:Uncharacterized protein n=1 Tax=Araneus ventricosus TaxID=182803 RepID=A0A4Y2D5C1_ARAVE|nr:hypothetical protein AVEN_133911-1 [Araneus ventricosus]
MIFLVSRISIDLFFSLDGRYRPFLSCSRHLNNSLKNTSGLKGLYWRALLTKTLAAENEAVAPGRKKIKDRVTILGSANASDSHRVKLTLLEKTKNITKTVLPVHYMHQESAWMNSNLFSE